MTYLYIFVELGIGLIVLFAMTKLNGKTQISQITPFEFISALVLGELVGNAIYDKEVSVLQILFAVIVWAALLVGIEWIELKFLKLRGFLEGNPSIVVRHGMIDKKELKKNKMTINQLQNMLRQKNVFSFREVEYAILESNGMLTVLKKPEYDVPVRRDLGLTGRKVALPVTLINDGVVLEDNLKKSGYNMTWLEKQLRAQGYDKPEQVFYAEWDEERGMHIVPMPS